jgi:hypothetical protein
MKLRPFFLASLLVLASVLPALASEDDEAAAALALAKAKLMLRSSPAVTETVKDGCACPYGGMCTCQGGVCRCGAGCSCANCPGSDLDRYAAALARAVKEKRALVVGVKCDPPKGNWVSVRVDELLPGTLGKCVVLAVPNAQMQAGMEWLDTFAAGTTEGDIINRLGRRVATPAQAVPVQYSAPVQFRSGGGRSC